MKLHAALSALSSRIGDGLVVFPSRRRAGKSTLIARLASLGVQVFADDILPLAEAGAGVEARALGVCSRLRLPLPAGIAPEFRAHCERWRGPEDRYYRYLLAEDGLLAPHGARAGISAFVFLDRVEGDAPPELFVAPRSMAMEALLLQNFGIAARASEIFGRLQRLVAAAGVHVLRYGALDPAARLLAEAFGAGRQSRPEAAGARIPLPPAVQPGGAGAVAPDAALRRADGAVAREIDGRRFVLDDERGAIFALDGIGGAIWELLAEPVTPREIEEVLAGHFAAVPADVIGRDVRNFLAALVGRGLAGPAGAIPDRAGEGPGRSD